jgi:hypothetical protein
MGEYEDRYPDAYGHGEVVDSDSAERRFTGIGLPRQTRDARVPIATADNPSATAPAERRPPQPRPRVVRQVAYRTSEEISRDVVEQLNASPFIDASGIAVSVNGSEVTLDGTINTLMAISLSQALVSNIAGVSRVQVHLRVRPAPRTYEAPRTPVYRTGG